MKNLILFGASGHAKVLIDAIERAGLFSLLGLLDPSTTKKATLLGYPILGNDEDLQELTAKYPKLFFAIAIGDNAIRKRIAEQICQNFPSIEPATIIHPLATISKRSSVGKGCFIAAGAIIGPDAVIGDFAIVNTGSSIDHDVKLGNFSSVAPQVAIGGNVMIGETSAICIGATVVDGITVGDNVTVGAQSLVVRSLESNVVAYGIPARIIRSKILKNELL